MLDKDNSITVHTANDQNVQLSNKSVPDTQTLCGNSFNNTKKSYTKSIEILEFVNSKGVKGITFKDIMSQFKCSKKEAQRKIKYLYLEKNLLITIKDLGLDDNIDIPNQFKNQNPQKYYHPDITAKLIEEIKQYQRNVLLQHTMDRYGYRVIYNNRRIKPINRYPSIQATCLYDILLARGYPLYIHKLQLMLSVSKDYYNTLERIPNKGNLGKLYEERIDTNHVKYTYYPNGTVTIFVINSKYPFKLETSQDVDEILVYLGHVRAKILDHVCDPTGRNVPPVMEWILNGCDLNKDIRIDSNTQINFPSLQVKEGTDVFRAYTKPLGVESVYRIEKSWSPQINITNALNDALKNDTFNNTFVKNIKEQYNLKN